MGKLRFESYEEFAKRIEFPVIIFKAETGEVALMNYESKLVLGQKTQRVEIKLTEDQSIEDQRFFALLHDRKTMVVHSMLLMNETRKFTIEGILNEFDVGEELYYMLLFEQRALTGGNQRIVEEIVENSRIVLAHITFAQGKEFKVDYISKNIKQYGFTCEEFYTGKLQYKDIIHPDDQDMVIGTFEENYKGQKNDDSLEYRIVTESRKVRVIYSTVHFTRDQYGFIDGMEMIMRDATEERLEQTENQYLRSVIEQSNSVVMVSRFKNNRSTIKYVSANAKALGLDVEDLQMGRKRLLDYVVPEHKQIATDILYNVDHEHPLTRNGQCRFRGEDGEYRWVSLNVTAKYIDENIYDSMLLARDITEEKVREQNMLQNQKELEERLDYIVNGPAESLDWAFDDILSRREVEHFLRVYADNNQLYAVGVNPKGTLLTKPVGPMFRLGEFYDIIERPENHMRVEQAILQCDEVQKFIILELEEGNPERQIGVLPVVIDGRAICATVVCGLDAEMVMRMHNSIESLQAIIEIVVKYKFHQSALEMESRKSRLAEEMLRKELDGQLILAQAFANMRNDVNATVQEILVKSCELLRLSAMAVYYGEPAEEKYSCIASYSIFKNDEIEFPNPSFRMAELCRNHERLSSGNYIIYSPENYVPELESLAAEIQAGAMVVCGIRVHHVVCAGVIFVSREERIFQERELSYCMNVAHIIQGILYRKQMSLDVSMLNQDLLKAYNYMKEYVFIKETQSGKVLFANEAMENLFGVDITGTDSRAFLSEPVPIYTREGAQSVGDVKWQSYVPRVGKIMNIQELSMVWKNGKDAKLVIMREFVNEGASEHN